MQTEQPGFIAEETLFWAQPDGSDKRIVARIGTPYTDDGEVWRCAVELDGGIGRLSDQAGDSSMQALTLATRLVATLLLDMLERGEQLFHADGDRGQPWTPEGLPIVFGRGLED